MSDDIQNQNGNGENNNNDKETITKLEGQIQDLKKQLQDQINQNKGPEKTEEEKKAEEELNYKKYLEDIKKMDIQSKHNILIDYAKEAFEIMNKEENYNNFKELCKKHNINVDYAKSN